MIKFGLYIKNTSESNNHINTVEMPTVNQAEAYFAGVKQLSLEQFTQAVVFQDADAATNDGLIRRITDSAVASNVYTITFMPASPAAIAANDT